MKFRYRIADRLGYDLKKKKKATHDLIERHVARLLRERGMNCVLDVGANVGQYAEGLREAGYQGWIISFEPVGESYARLAEKCERDERWKCLNFALGSQSGESEMRLHDESMLASMLPASGFALGSFAGKFREVAVERVQVKRLDEIFDDLVSFLPDPQVFLKMDTQGYDLEVFAGSDGCLDRIRGLQSELSVTSTYEGTPDYYHALGQFRSRGYEVTGFYPVVRDPKTGLLIEFDCVMLRTRLLPGASLA